VDEAIAAEDVWRPIDHESAWAPFDDRFKFALNFHERSIPAIQLDPGCLVLDLAEGCVAYPLVRRVPESHRTASAGGAGHRRGPGFGQQHARRGAWWPVFAHLGEHGGGGDLAPAREAEGDRRIRVAEQQLADAFAGRANLAVAQVKLFDEQQRGECLPGSCPKPSEWPAASPDTAADGTLRHRSGRPNKEDQQSKIRLIK
jgi:hypothetical protein